MTSSPGRAPATGRASSTPGDPPAGNPVSTGAVAVWVALAVVYLVWGSTYLAIRVTVESLPPMLSAALRFGAAAAVLAVVLRLRGGPGALAVGRRQLGGAVLAGVLLLAGGNG